MRKGIVSIIILSATLLSSCTFNTFSRYTNYPKDNDTYYRIEGDNYYKPDSYSIEFEDVYRSFPHEGDRQINLPSLGEQNLLVVPVSFSDYTCSSLSLGCNDTITQIKNVFFGKESRTKGESVASFYAKSSYGKLKLSGEVTSWYHTEVTRNDILSDDSNQSKLANLLITAGTWARTQVEDVSRFDLDNDGYLDAVCFIYSAPYQVGTNLWAYKANLNTVSNKSEPSVKNFLWASQEFMGLSNMFSKPEARTYIHEVGHLFGLDDYYPTDNIQTFSPLGKIDMMDLSIGDHNVFSKMLLSWIRPYVVTGNSEITISTSSTSPQCILLKNDWNGSAMDEYILLELYSPLGLNLEDSKKIFTYGGNNRISPITQVGVKIYHVDARIGYYMTYPSNSFIGYDSEETREKVRQLEEAGQRTYRRIAAHNTASTSQNGNYLITLLEPNEISGERECASNASLFKKGSQLNNYTFNDGTSLGYRISVDDIIGTSATIKFEVI